MFGYEKTDGENARTFDITLYSKLSLDGIHDKIFTKYEVHIMLTNSVRKMLQMKPVMLKDFEMLLLPSNKTFMYENQKNESFLMPQEMFMGKTMVDIELIKPDEISKNLSNFLEKKSKQINGSLADMLI